MKVEILATGDEIRTGALVDSNSAHIALKLEENGIEVARHTCVGDDLSMLTDTFLEIGRRADATVVTGGLGPTIDDLSAEAAASAAGVGLIFDDRAFESISRFFQNVGRPMPESNRKQALFPRTSEILDNTVGTAPGFSITIGRCRFFFLPGVPHEMKRMLDAHVIPALVAMQGDAVFHSRVTTINTFGLPESLAGEKVAGVEAAFPGIKLGLRANFPQIQVKLYGRAENRTQLDESLDAAGRWVVSRLGDHVLSQKGERMEVVVGNLLRQKGATLALAESCTGGLIANWLTDVPGSSDYFLFSGVTYSNRAKTDVLAVRPETLERFGAVHEDTAREMAEGARNIAGATYGLATSGIAGPGGGTADKPVGTVCIGFAGPSGSFGKRKLFRIGKRSMKKQMFAMAALDTLRRELLR